MSGAPGGARTDAPADASPRSPAAHPDADDPRAAGATAAVAAGPDAAADPTDAADPPDARLDAATAETAHGDSDTDDDTDPDGLVARFFGALAGRDPARLAQCYHPLVSYSSPLFPDLRGPLPAQMWRLGLARADALRVQWDVVFADPRKAQIRWTARWRQGSAERRLAVATTLAIWDGRVVRQIDEFRFPAFAAQAFGLRGRLLGAVGPWRRAVQRRALAALEASARAGQAAPDDPGTAAGSSGAGGPAR